MTVELINQRSEPHNFYIPGVVAEVAVGPGESHTYTFTAPATGTYIFYDSLSPLHRSMGLYRVW